MDEQQILSLFHEYSNMVYRLAYNYLGSPQDAEDLVQTVFLKLIDGKALPETGKERAFLTRITINCCKDQLRSAWRRRTVPIDDSIPFQHSEDRELFHAVMELPEKYRIVIYLHYYEGYTFPEIAEFLKISPSGVSMRMHRARKILKKQLVVSSNLWKTASERTKPRKDFMSQKRQKMLPDQEGKESGRCETDLRREGL